MLSLIPNRNNMAQSSSEVDFWEGSCCTTSKVLRLRFKWTIENFSLQSSKVGDVLRSSFFPAEATSGQQWYLRLHPGGEVTASAGWVSLFLVPRPPLPKDVEVTYNFAILNAQGKEARQLAEHHCFKRDGPGRGYNKYIERNSLLDPAQGLLPGDKLTLLCEVKQLVGSVNVSRCECCALLPDAHGAQALDDMGQLFETAKLSDVSLSVDGHDILAHKNILMARSAVFAAMFGSGMKESRDSRVVVEDVDFEVLRELLRYIYTGRVANLQGMAADLLAAADKYAVIQLKDLCGRALRATLSIANATELLILAHLHNAKELKNDAVNFIKMHTADIVNSDAWGVLARSHPDLATEVFRSVHSSPSPCATAKKENA